MKRAAIALLGLVLPGGGTLVQGQTVVINEVLANPSPLVGSEWVELYNAGEENADLTGWRIGDALRLVPLADTGLTVPALGYLLLVQHEAAFRSHYSDVSGPVVEVGSWPILNNDGDTVRLLSAEGEEMSLFAYDDVFSFDATWSRDPDNPGHWGQSLHPGGTPGETNELVALRGGREVGLEISPTVFSPDGDGVDDTVLIRPTADFFKEHKVEVYDREGRLVWEERIELGGLQSAYVWDGRSSSGSRQPVGIYVVNFESSGGESAKATVVIAR